MSGEEIKKLWDMDSVIKMVEGAFRLEAMGETVMPPKIYLDLPKYNGDFRAMLAYIN